ncbi:MAG: integrase arm-type DNA-binding domain-containing protein [Plesiomonas sp.]
MAKVTTRLSDTQIKAAKPRDKEYVLCDGDGLRIRVKPNGSKPWLLNYTHPIKKTRTNLSLGKYPEVSLASTTLNEQGFEPDLIEAALAYVDDNQVRSAYYLPS